MRKETRETQPYSVEHHRKNFFLMSVIRSGQKIYVFDTELFPSATFATSLPANTEVDFALPVPRLKRIK